MASGAGRPPEKIQIIMIGSVVALLVVASVWPKLIVPACLLMLVVIWFAARAMKPGPAAAAAPPRGKYRRIAAILLAVGLVIWAILSVRR